MSYSHEITSKKRFLLFCLGKLANVLLRNFITTHWEHFLKHWYNALMVAQKSCGCWCRLTTSFAVHIRRYRNRNFNQHMIFRYCEEGSGEPVQTCRLPRAFAASTRDLDIYYIVQCSPIHELNHQLLGRAINCNGTGGLCARCHHN